MSTTLKSFLKYSPFRRASGTVLVIFFTSVSQAAPLSYEIAVGQRAPSFLLQDQSGRKESLEELLKEGPVAVVFIRSIEWCTYCQLQTIQLQRNLTEIQAHGQIVVVTYDPLEKVKLFASRRKITYPILSDSDSKTIDAYAMRSRDWPGGKPGSAVHGAFVIDQTGIVRAKPYLTSFEERSVVEVLVKTLDEARKTPESPKP